MKRGIIIFLFLIIIFSTFISASNIGLIESETWQNNLTSSPTLNGAVLGDIDNDGDLDMISIGCTLTTHPCNNNPDKTRIFTNNGTAFQENQTWQQNLSDTSPGSLALGDIDNDGDLDLITSGPFTKIYINNGTTFQENQTWQNTVTGEEGASSDSIALGDIDNDGDLDLIFPDMSDDAPVTVEKIIWLNNGTTFINSTIWGQEIIEQNAKISTGLNDVDNDGDLDLHIIGQDFAKGYENNGTSFVAKGVWNTFREDEASVAWGDIDNDGDFDHIITGFSTSISINEISSIDGFTDNTTQWDLDLSAYFFGSMMLGDYDNNGYLDLVLLGGSSPGKLHVAENNGTNFARDATAEANLTGDRDSSALWGDIDNDGDLDLVVIKLQKVYISNASLTNPNEAPTPPTTFSSSYNNRKISLGWLNGSDNETTSTGLYYNLKLGTASNNHSIISGIYGGQGDATRGGTAFGYFGNMMQRKNFTLNVDRLSPSTTYYWSVQTIDTGLKAGNFSTVQSFTTSADLTRPVITLNSPVDNANLSSYTVTFNATVTDNSNLTNVTLWGNWTGTFKINESNSSGINGTYIFTKDLTGFGDGKYTWLIQATDNETNVQNSSTLTFTIDTTPPTHSNNQTNTTLAGAAINFSILWNDNIALHPNGQYVFSTNNTGTWINDSVVNFTATPEWANVTKTLNSTVGTLVGYQWYVNDSVGNVNNTGEFTLVTTDTVKPQPEFGTNPIDVFNSSNSSVTFDFKASDNLDIDYISLYGNWSGGWHANYTNTSYTSDTYLNITVNNLLDGKYVWGIFANDSTGNTNFTLTNRTFTIDTIKPNLTSISSSVGSTTATITWTSDESSNSSVLYGTTISLGSSTGSTSLVTSHSIALSSLSASTLYYYNVSSCDSSNNCNTSTQRSFTTSAASSPSGGGGGGGGGSAVITQPKEFDIDFSNVSSGGIGASQGEIKTFSFNGQTTHKFTVSEVTETTVKLIIESEPIILVLSVGETKQVDINQDDINDLEIKLVSIIRGKANFLLEKLEGADIVAKEELEKEPLFDVKVSISDKYKRVFAGEEVTAEIEVFNVNNIGQVDVILNYYLSDNKNTTILTKASDTLAVEAVTSFVRTLTVPENTGPGTYLFYTNISYKDIITSSYAEFKVKREILRFVEKWDKEIIISIIILVSIIVLVYLRRIGKLEKKEKSLERVVRKLKKKRKI